MVKKSIAVVTMCDICLLEIPMEMWCYCHAETRRVICNRCIRAIEGAIEKQL